jgi:DNA-binding NtrC family response regulator
MPLLENPNALERVAPLLVRPLKTVERATIESAMILCQGDRELAANRLQIGRSTLWRKLRGYREEDEQP